MTFDELNNLSDEYILNNAPSVAGQPNSGISGFYVSGSVDSATVVTPYGIGGDVTFFVGIDRATGERVTAWSLGIFGVAGVSYGKLEGGVFTYTGTPEQMGGFAAGISVTAGFVSGGGEIDTSGEIMLMGGGAFGMQVAAGGYIQHLLW